MATHNTVWFNIPAPRVTAGREPQFIEFEENWLAELAPQGPLEMEAFHDFLRSAWRKREVIDAQNQLGDVSFIDEGPAARKFQRLLRYESDFESRCARAIARLRKLQAQRTKAAAKTASAPAQAPYGIPDHVAQTLHIMDVETRHFNAHVRARKAGIIEPVSWFERAPLSGQPCAILPARKESLENGKPNEGTQEGV